MFRLSLFAIALLVIAAPYRADAQSAAPNNTKSSQAAPAPTAGTAAAKPSVPPVATKGQTPTTANPQASAPTNSAAPEQPQAQATQTPVASPVAQPPTPGLAAPPPSAPTAAAGAMPVVELEPHGYTYDSEGRRDPFVSLLRRGSDMQGPPAGARIAGLAGLETNEVTLKGTFLSRGEYVGIVLGVDNKTYIVKPGDKVLDGTVHTISQDAMVITQEVNDPLSLEKQREVRKLLRQTEEAK
jgi:Tfp pilus assembly protein PilP